VLRKAYGFNTSSKPLAECRATEDMEGPGFGLRFDALKKIVIGDTFIERKLGRQVEDIITECFNAQGIEVAPIGIIRNPGDDPDITFTEYMATEVDFDKFSFEIVLPDSVEISSENKSLVQAFVDFQQRTKMRNRVHIYIVKAEDLSVFQKYLRTASEMNGVDRPRGKVFNGFVIGIKEDTIEIIDTNDWSQYSY
jgi:hypothetical protein